MRKILLTRVATPVVLAAFIAAAVASAYAFTAREQRDGASRGGGGRSAAVSGRALSTEAAAGRPKSR